MKTRTFYAVGVALALVSLQTGCYYDVAADLYPEVSCDTASTGFAARVQPLVASQCALCHGGADPDGGLALESYADISAAALNGSIENRITRSSGDALLMPPSGALGTCDVQALLDWAAAGALEN